MRWTVALTVISAFASLAVGCGGGSSSGSTTTAPPISKAEFIKKADSVCTRAGKQTEAEFTAFAKKHGVAPGKEPSPEQYAEIAKAILIPALKQQVDEIRAFGTPTGDEDLISRFLNAVDAAVEEAEAKPQEAGKSPSKLLASADKLIKNYGFKVCGQ